MNGRILIVDESPNLLEIFSIILKLHGFEVKITDKTDNIEEFFNTFLPDLLLLGVRLNGSSGRFLCKEIKDKFNKEIPIILVSASPELVKDYEEYLAVNVSEKPFEIKTFTEKINFTLNKSRCIENSLSF